MSEVHYACPECGCIEICVESEGLFDKDGLPLGKGTCPSCNWHGRLADTLGFATTETVWDLERIGTVMLRTVARHAAGPLVQLLEFIGFLHSPQDPKFRSSSEFRHLAQELRDETMRRITEAAVTAAFEAAQDAHLKMQEFFASSGIDPVTGQKEKRT